MSMFRQSFIAAIGFSLAQIAAANPVIYSQAWAGAADMYSSQNDTTTGGFGNFATVYDDFRLSANYRVTDVHWTGGFFNPASAGAITSFRIAFYADNAGQPGAALYSAVVAGNANETSLGTVGGFPMFTYSVDLGTEFLATANTRYWMSIVPDLAFPPQWGIASGTGGNGIGFQDFLGTRGQIPDLAFDLTGLAAVPEPGSIPLVALALAGLVALRRRNPAA